MTRVAFDNPIFATIIEVNTAEWVSYGSKHIKSPKERYLLRQKQHLQIFGVIPYVKLQNDT